MRKFVVMLTVLVVVASFVVFPMAAPRVQAQDFQTYDGDVFSIQYPAGWQASPYGDLVQHGVVFAQQAITVPYAYGFADFEESESLIQTLLNGPAAGILTLPIQALDADERDPRELMEDLMGEYDVISTERTRPIVLGDAQGVEVIGVIDAGDYQFGVHSILVINDTTLLLFAAGVLQANYETYRAAFAQMAQSIVLRGDEPPAIAPVDPNSNGLTTYEGFGYTIGRPAEWNVATIETFDGGLAAFCPQPLRLVNEDLEQIEEWLTYGYAEDVSPDLINCVRSVPTVGILTIPVALTDYEREYAAFGGPAVSYLQRILNAPDEFASIDAARRINLGGFEAAEFQATLVDESSGQRYGVYVMALMEGDWLRVLAAVAPLEQFTANLELIHNIAYSMVPTPLPDYSSGDVSTLNPNEWTEGYLDDSDGVEVWEFEGEAGQAIQIELESDSFDTYLEVYLPDGSYWQSNDDYNGSNSWIDDTLPASGTYEIHVSSFDGDWGDYYIVVWR